MQAAGRFLLAAASLWWREQVRFLRQRSRLVGALLTPLLFWLLVGSGLGASFQAAAPGGGQDYLEYFFPGALVLLVLFTAIFSTISVIEDRREGFLQAVLVAPVPRAGVRRALLGLFGDGGLEGVPGFGPSLVVTLLACAAGLLTATRLARRTERNVA